MQLYSREKLIESSSLGWIILAASLSFLFTMFLPSVGEEGVYTNITLEMMYNNDYLVPTLYGVDYYRPPLFNWFMLGLTKLFGPAHVVFAARLVNVTATLGTAGLLIWFVRRIFAHRNFALLTGAIYLSGDLLFKRGWLAYADSLFAFFTFASIVCLWMALEQQQRRWFVAASLSLVCGFLTKVHTIYLFYAVAGLVLMLKHQNRNFLFTPSSWLLHALALVFPVAWGWYIRDGYQDLGATANYSQTLFKWPGLFAYLYHLVVAYPLNLILRFMPASLIALVMWYKMRAQAQPVAQQQIVTMMLSIVLLNLLPYWIAPSSTIRYILPLYPFISLLIAYVIWRAGNAAQVLTVKLLIVTLVLKYVVAIGWLPYEHNVYRGNALEVATDILARTKDADLYINDTTSPGLRMATALNSLRTDKAPLTVAPSNFSGYLLSDRNEARFGTLVTTYSLRTNKLYLLSSAGTE